MSSTPTSLHESPASAFSALPPPASRSAIIGWRYQPDASRRDLRIDFLRGLAVFSLIINHIEIFSAFNLLTWERIGVVSGAEGFVSLAGVVLGAVHRKKIMKSGLGASANALLDRALELYRIDVCLVVSIGLLSLLRFLDVRAAMTFTDRGAGVTYSLYSAPGKDWHAIVSKTLLLQYGPHQTQILGLYTVLLFVSPAVLWALSEDRFSLVLGLSWILYLKNWAAPDMPTGAQFEYGFPVLSWQLIFFHGMVFGYYKKEITAWFTPARRKIALSASYIIFFGFMFFTLNNPYPSLPPWARLSIINPDRFTHLYSLYFLKNSLGILRLANFLVALIVAYHLLTLFWTGIHKALGWFFLPFGQASLYVFILHIYVLILIYNLPTFQGLVPSYTSGNIWLNTAGHAAALMILWFLVRFQVAYRWIPR